MKLKIAAGGAMAAALCANALAEAPQRTPPYAENDNRFDLAKVTLTQLHPSKPAFVVSSDGGAAFDRADTGDDAASPFRLKAEFECPEGSGDADGQTFFTFDADLDDLTLQAIGAKDMMGDGDAFPGALAGDLVTDVWPHDDPEAWIASEKDFAIEACNAAAQAKRAQSPGMSMKVAMSRVGTIYPYAGAGRKAGEAKLKSRCVQPTFERGPNGSWVPADPMVWEGQTTLLKLKLPVKCDAPLRPVRPSADRLTAGFGVTAARLEAEPTFVKGQCPREIAFNGAFEASGAGQVKYRIRGSDGALSGVNTINVSSSGPTALGFVREFGKKSVGGLVTPPPAPPSPPDDLAVPGPDGDPKGPTLKAPTAPPAGGSPAAGAGQVAAATAEGEISGWMRVEIVSPTAGVKKSNDAFYKVICREEKTPEGIGLSDKQRSLQRPVRKGVTR